MNSHNQQRAILGTLALDPGLFIHVSEYLTSPDMFSPDLRKVAAFIWAKCGEGRGFDLPMLKDATDAALVDELVHHQATEDLLTQHARQVVEAWQSEQATRILDTTRRTLAEGGDYAETMGGLQSELDKINAIRTEPDDRGRVIRASVESIEKAMLNEGMTGVPSGLRSVDEFTGGAQPGNLIVVGARAGMGKTTFLCEWALGAANDNRPVAFFSFGDMTKSELTKKMISMISGISYKKIMLGRLTKDDYRRILDAAELLHELPIHIIDMTDMPPNVSVMRDKARRMREHLGIELFIGDYIQQMRPDNPTHRQVDNISEVTRILKNTAAMLDLPFLVASQLSRAVENRGGSKRPQLSDLRDSGTIEQDANQIFFLYRPDYYGITEDEEGRSVVGMTELIAAKDRAGGTGETLLLNWRNERFADLEEVSPQFPATVSNHIPAQSVPDEDLPF